jgi:hypothetical protein
MQAFKFQTTPRAARYLFSALLAFPTFAFSQDPPPPPAPTYDPQAAPAPASGWKRVGDPSRQTEPQNNGVPDNSTMQPGPPLPPGDPNGNGQPGYPAYGQPSYGQQPNTNPNYPAPPNYPAQSYRPVPATLTVPAGTYLTVRVNQMLSSDRNQTGDAFSATLIKPLVVNGVVVAEPGQTIGGRVVEAVKAGHIEGVARLGVQLTDLTLTDGQQLPIHSSLISRAGPTSVGQDAGTIAGTTALGAAIGAAAGWGKGAAIGAGSGAALGIIGVLVTRGHPSVLYPEQILTFRIEAPMTISTEHAPQAFHYVQPGEYDQPTYGQQPPPQYGYSGGAPYPPAPAPYYYGYPYPAYGSGYPYYWGPSFSLFFGGRYYGGYRYWSPGGRYYYGSGYAHIGGGGFHASVRGGSHR